MRHTLIIRLSALGDVAMTIPVIYSLVEQYPDDKFTVLTQPFAGNLFINHPDNLNLVFAQTKDKHKGMAGIYRLYKELSIIGITDVADLHDVLRSKILRTLLAFNGKNVCHIDKGRKEKKDLIAKPIKSPLKSTFTRYFEVFEKLNIKITPSFKSLYKTQKADPEIFSEFTGTKQGKWIGIAPFAKHEGKIYPFDQMEVVIESLSKEENVTIFLFGGKREEADMLSKTERKYKNVKSLAGKASMKTEIAIISHLDCMISMDSANMHLASLVNVPVVSIWGATHPNAGFLGWNQSLDNVVQSSLLCRPCSIFGNKKCMYLSDSKHQTKTFAPYQCMKDLMPAIIINKIKKIINL